MQKAQVTVFIIIGLVLMVSVGFVIYFAQKRVAGVEEVLFVPPEAKPVHDFVTNCIDITARDALQLLGAQAGFISIPPIIAKTPLSYIPLDRSGSFKTPLWYYEGEDRVPSLQDMEREMNEFVADRLKGCTREFGPFAQFTIAEQGNVSVQTTIAEDDVHVRVTWLLLLTKGQTTTAIREYVVREPVRLKKLWETAKAIMDAENRGSFFENLTIDWMSANPEIPMNGFEFSCKTRRWKIPEVKKELQTILAINLPYVRVKNTQVPPFLAKPSAYRDLAKARERMLKNFEAGQTLEQQKLPPDPGDAYEFFKMTIDAGAPVSDLIAGFTYQPEWGMSLSAQPNDGQRLSSNTGRGTSNLLRFFCINQWHFTYDVIYPVRVVLRDDSAFTNAGFLFSFGFPVLIDNNAEDRVNFGIQKFQDVPATKEFCGEFGNQLADIRATGTVVGSAFATELEGANITYKCFTELCDLGKTRADGGVYRLRTYLPKGCVNPLITASKDGYLSATKPLVGDKVKLDLKRLTKVNTSVVVHPYYLPEKRFLSQLQKVTGLQNLFVHVVLKNSTFEQIVALPGNETALEFLTGKGEYGIDAILSVGGEQIGGYRNERLKISAEDIAGAKEVVVHVVEFRPHPRTDNEKIDMTNFLFANKEYVEELKPEFR
ncbi:hypothetical protein HY490_03940 [Candidatus Woesearchaeota archaeon]|nr:hypothetical protein [Candidatus Woesearchaeota archaeon]